ncbi:MAG: hypothetical protein KF813_06115 [Trueperaceae bacterium]|nr:hypothetical protein [Trueperaceae bacterium]
MRPIVVMLTIAVVALLTQPLWAPQWGVGILGEVAALGTIGSILAVAVFFGLVAVYCQSLMRLLERVRPEARARTPRSVWLMFAIPFNFIEDFFIVSDIRSSLMRDARFGHSDVAIWYALGLGWCSLQLVSLVPGVVGFASGAVALLAWAAHWWHTTALTRRLPAE